MAITKTIQATVKNRTDTAANWTQKNPVLAEGEIIVVQTSAGETRLKIGDGVKTFTQLPYTDEQIYNNVVTSVNGQTGDVTLDIPGGGADWAQNDPDGDGYIKNRPGGYDVIETRKIFEMKLVSINDENMLTADADGSFAEGTPVHVSIDGAPEVICTIAVTVSGEIPVYSFGSKSYDEVVAGGLGATDYIVIWYEVSGKYLYQAVAGADLVGKTIVARADISTPVKIPEKYLDLDSAKEIVLFTISYDQRSDTFESDRTYDELVADLNAGKLVLAEFRNCGMGEFYTYGWLYRRGMYVPGIYVYVGGSAPYQWECMEGNKWTKRELLDLEMEIETPFYEHNVGDVLTQVKSSGEYYKYKYAPKSIAGYGVRYIAEGYIGENNEFICTTSSEEVISRCSEIDDGCLCAIRIIDEDSYTIAIAEGGLCGDKGMTFSRVYTNGRGNLYMLCCSLNIESDTVSWSSYKHENIPTVDDTLTQSGQAADASVVGNRLSALSEEIVTTSESKVAAHNTGTDTHSDIRLLIQGLTDRLNALADSDDTTLDQLSEVVAYIKSNRSLIEAITTSKVSVADIIDNLTTNVSNKPLSAAQGVALKELIDAMSNSMTAYRTAAAQDEIDSGKVDKENGKGLSTNDYTAADKAKVDAIPANPKYTDTVYDDTALKERVATIEGKESSWDAKSDFSGSYNDLTDKPTPLTGTTKTLTPTQVDNAMSAGIPVKVQYFDETYGWLSYTNFNIAENMNMIVANSISIYYNTYILSELYGDKTNNTWGFTTTTLAEKADIPETMPNPNAITFTGAVTDSYDGSEAVTINIPEGSAGNMKKLTFTGAVTGEYDGTTDVNVDIPIATSSTAGTIKVGNGLSISADGTLSVTTATYYTGTSDPVNTLGADDDLYLKKRGDNE